MMSVGWILLGLAIRALEITGVARKGTASMAKEMIHGGDCIAEAGRKKLFTPMHHLLGVKRK